MAKIVAYFEFSEMTQKNYDDVIHELKAQGSLYNEQRPSHVAFQKGSSWCVVDVWESEQALMEFANNTLIPIFKKLGLNPIQPEIYPVHNYLGVRAEETISA